MQITSSTIYMALPLFFEQFGISKTENGVLISIGTLAGVFSGLIAGKFSDNYGRKKFLVAGTAIYAVVFYLFTFMSKDFNTCAHKCSLIHFRSYFSNEAFSEL